MLERAVNLVALFGCFFVGSIILLSELLDGPGGNVLHLLVILSAYGIAAWCAWNLWHLMRQPSPDSNVNNYTRTSTQMKGFEATLYLLLRAGVAVVGLLWILGTCTSHFMMETLLYDEPPGPPPLSHRLPAILLNIGIGALLVVPHRWTLRPSLFWPRLIIYGLLGLYLIWKAISGVWEGLSGDRSSQIVHVSIFIGLFGVALPVMLAWSRKLRRKSA